MIIAWVNLKGGVGKTTSTVYTAIAAARRGMPALVADANPDASATQWIEEGIEQHWITGVQVVMVPSERLLGQLLQMPLSANEVIVIDTPPNSDRLSSVAMALADVILVPTRVGGPEPERVRATLDLAPAGKARGIVVCSGRTGTRGLSETLRGWEAVGESVWGVVPERVGIAAGGSSEPHAQGIDAYDAILSRALSIVKEMQ